MNLKYTGERWNEQVETDDVRRIVQVFAERDCTVSPEDAKAAWEKYSSIHGARWRWLPVFDEALFALMKDMFVETKDE